PSRQEGMPNRLVPVVEWMEVGPEGEMWIRDPTRLQDSTAKWTCIDRGGTPRASVLFRSRPFAASTSVMGIGKSGLILRGSDADGAAILRIVNRPEGCL